MYGVCQFEDVQLTFFYIMFLLVSIYYYLFILLLNNIVSGLRVLISIWRFCSLNVFKFGVISIWWQLLMINKFRWGNFWYEKEKKYIEINMESMPAQNFNKSYKINLYEDPSITFLNICKCLMNTKDYIFLKKKLLVKSNPRSSWLP